VREYPIKAQRYIAPGATTRSAGAVIALSLRFAKNNVAPPADSLMEPEDLTWKCEYSTTETVMSLHSTDIQVTYDFICPWCWIGEENLERALAASGFSTDRQMTFLPYQLNPDMPISGMDRKAYRSGKFGSWARSQAMDAQVAHAGKAVGLEFDYKRVEKTPNTLAAHRLVWREQQTGRDACLLVKAIFKGYFGDGRDIGDLNVLADIAAEIGRDREAIVDFLNTDEGTAEVLKLEARAKASGVRSVPSIQIADDVISGAQPTGIIVQILKRSQAA